MPSDWQWTEDRQWSSSRIVKGGSETNFLWVLEVRTESRGGNHQRMGEIYLRGEAGGELTCRIFEEDD